MNFELYIGRPVTDFENDSIKVSGVGFYDSVSDFEKSRGVKLRQLEAGYAERLISSGAFVPYKHYETYQQQPLKNLERWALHK